MAHNEVIEVLTDESRQSEQAPTPAPPMSPITQMRLEAAVDRDKDLEEMAKKYRYTALVRRKRFVLAYLETFNCGHAYRAVQPPGVNANHETACIRGSKLLAEPYCRAFLEKCLSEIKEDELIDRRKVIEGFMREANNFGDDASGASRVSALRELAKILGMQIDRSMSLNVNATAPAPISEKERSSFLEKFKDEFTA